MLARALSQAACGLVLLLAAVGTASAGSFQVNPVRATLSASMPVDSLTVRNTGAEPAVVQLQVVSWAQQEDQDIYTPTRDMLATPPIFTLPAGGSQLVRVGLRGSPDPQRELTYRLFLQEVPPPPKPDFQGLQVALRVSVPVFVLPTVAAKPVLRWQAKRTLQGKLQVGLINSGNAHIRVSNFKLAPANGEPLPPQEVATYVLPGQSRSWLVDAAQTPAPGSTLRLVAQTDVGEVQAELVVEP